MHTTSLIPLTLLLHVHSALAIIFPFEARSVKREVRLHARADISGQTGGGNGTVPIANTHNAEYISNIVLGGQTIPVMLDTGRCGSFSACN